MQGARDQGGGKVRGVGRRAGLEDLEDEMAHEGGVCSAAPVSKPVQDAVHLALLQNQGCQVQVCLGHCWPRVANGLQDVDSEVCRLVTPRS